MHRRVTHPARRLRRTAMDIAARVKSWLRLAGKGEPGANGGPPGQLGVPALAHPPAYDHARAVAHFTGSMRTLVHHLKYADRHDGRALFGRWLAEAARDLDPGFDLIVPVPLSRLRLLLRHFNQAAVLDKLARGKARVPVPPRVSARRKPRSAADQ